MYADDNSLCLKSKDISQINIAMNRDLEDLDAWLKGNNLSLNIVKRKSMVIATKLRYQAINNATENANKFLPKIFISANNNTIVVVPL